MILNIIMVVFYTKSGSVVMAKGGSVIVARLQNTGSVIVAHNILKLWIVYLLTTRKKGKHIHMCNASLPAGLCVFAIETLLHHRLPVWSAVQDSKLE